MLLYNHKHLKPFRRELRTKGTPAEAELWRHLKRRQVEGLKFRRQYSVGNYILDFYCIEIRLAIELDGEVHFSEERQEYDQVRDAFLHKAGITVLRFENRVVFESLSVILNEIRSFKRDRST